jgi:hypothetical protein
MRNRPFSPKTPLLPAVGLAALGGIGLTLWWRSSAVPTRGADDDPGLLYAGLRGATVSETNLRLRGVRFTNLPRRAGGGTPAITALPAPRPLGTIARLPLRIPAAPPSLQEPFPYPTWREWQENLRARLEREGIPVTDTEGDVRHTVHVTLELSFAPRLDDDTVQIQAGWSVDLKTVLRADPRVGGWATVGRTVDEGRVRRADRDRALSQLLENALRDFVAEYRRQQS